MARNGFDRGRGLVDGVALGDETQRRVWVFLISNVLWVVRGWHVRAYALILLQVCLALLNIRGAQKNDPADAGTT